MFTYTNNPYEPCSTPTHPHYYLIYEVPDPPSMAWRQPRSRQDAQRRTAAVAALRHAGFQKSRVPFWGVPTIRVIV